MGRAQDFADNLNDDDFSLDNGDASATAVLDPPAQAAAPAPEPTPQAPAAPAQAAPLDDPGDLSLGPWAGQAPVAAAPQAPAQPAAAPPQAAAAPVAPQVPAGFAGYLASQGMTGFAEMEDGEAMEAFLGYIRNQEQQIEQQRQQAAWYQHQALLAQQAQSQQPQFQQPQQAAPAAQPAPVQSTWQKPPEWNPAWNALLTRDEHGNLVAVPGAQPDLPQKYRAHQEYLASMQAKMFDDPANFLLKEAGLEQHVRQMAQQVAQDQFNALQQQAAQQAKMQQMQALSQQITQQHSHWMYQRDPYGQPLRNPQTGEFLLTPDGLNQRTEMVRLLQAGVPQDMAFEQAYNNNMLRVALQALQEQQPAPNAPAAPATPQQAQQAANDAFLRARRQPNRNGTQPVAVNGNQPAQNEFDGLPREQRIGLMLRQAAAQAGFRLEE